MYILENVLLMVSICIVVGEYFYMYIVAISTCVAHRQHQPPLRGTHCLDDRVTFNNNKMKQSARIYGVYKNIFAPKPHAREYPPYFVIFFWCDERYYARKRNLNAHFLAANVRAKKK